VVVGPPKCSEVELVLPKQICTDIVYGYAAPETVPEPKPEVSNEMAPIWTHSPFSPSQVYHPPEPAYHHPPQQYHPVHHAPKYPHAS